MDRGEKRKPRRHYHQNTSRANKPVSVSGDSPILQTFINISKQLNERHDRHERLVKLSRDITIESKRIIFLLHSLINDEQKEKILITANERISKLNDSLIRNIGLEIENVPIHLHHRAVTPGFQEFIEAKLFYDYLNNGILSTWDQVQEQFKYKMENSNEDNSIKEIITPLFKEDFILGIADLTGELMRRVINSLSSGDSQVCTDTCQLVRDLYTAFLGLSNCGHEIGRKMSTTRANVNKVEQAVYALHVRGDEAPPSLLIPSGPPAHVPEDIEKKHDSDDEGFY